MYFLNDIFIKVKPHIIQMFLILIVPNFILIQLEQLEIIDALWVWAWCVLIGPVVYVILTGLIVYVYKCEQKTIVSLFVLLQIENIVNILFRIQFYGSSAWTELMNCFARGVVSIDMWLIICAISISFLIITFGMVSMVFKGK